MTSTEHWWRRALATRADGWALVWMEPSLTRPEGGLVALNPGLNMGTVWLRDPGPDGRAALLDAVASFHALGADIPAELRAEPPPA